MSSQPGSPPSQADLERQMLDVNRAIAGNPQDWKVYRDRGWIYAHKHEFDRALADLDMALRLKPDDARAYTRRGHIWKAAGQRQKAIVDYEAAMRLDPAHADAYRDMIRKAQRGENANTTTSAASTPKPQTTPAPASGLTGFFKRLAQYYAEFLSTDFKKQRLPRRRLQNADAQGRLVGIPLRKYPGFQQKLWADLAKPVGAGFSLTVARGSWRATLPKAVVEAIATHIAMVRQEDLAAVVTTVMGKVGTAAERKSSDPEIAFEQFVEGVRSTLAKSVIGPLLDRMEGFFERTEHKPIESLRELEDQLSARLINGIESSSGAAFSRLLVEHDPGPLETVLHDQLNEAVVRGELEEFFAGFSAGDLYVELSDLVRSSRLIDNVDFYLHIGEVKQAGHVFPIFYVPFTANRTEQGFNIHAEPRLYVNKRAMDYVAQETARAEGRSTIASVLRERIFYLLPEQAPLAIAQKLFDEMAGGFNLRADIDFGEPRDQKVSSLLVTATNNLSFSLFDRSDESMVNDYEALLTGIDAGTDVIGFFSDLIDQFLLKNPISVRAACQ